MKETISFILRGDICHTKTPDRLETHPDSFVVVRDNVCCGIYPAIPEEYAGLPVLDFSGHLIFPGLIDLHIHAPQYAFRGMGMDRELLDWLKLHAFPEEMKYADLNYADLAYGIFAEALKRGATTRASVFATIHNDATLLLMEKLEETGIVSFVGRVNMDRNAPEGLLDRSADHSIASTRKFLELAAEKGFQNTKPILTPRFIPSCTDALLQGLGALQKEFDLPVQSHLSENPAEVETVKQLMPEARFYGDGYDRFGLFGGSAPAIMAHCIYSPEEEIRRMKGNGVFVAHCPASNMNIASGIAPIRRYLMAGLKVGLGSDVAGGHTDSLFRAVTDAIQVSKLLWRMKDPEAKPLSFAEAFYLATKGGGSFFGKAGSFEEGFEFDAVILDDKTAPSPGTLSCEERMERAVYLGLDQTSIRAKFVRGKRII